MVRAPQRKVNRKISLRAAAAALGVNHGHLSRVIRGQRQSRSLIRRYNQLFRP